MELIHLRPILSAGLPNYKSSKLQKHLLSCRETIWLFQFFFLWTSGSTEKLIGIRSVLHKNSIFLLAKNVKNYQIFSSIALLTLSESLARFKEGQAFSCSCDLAPRPPPLPSVSLTGDICTGRLRKRDNLLTGEGVRGQAKSRIIRPQESLVLDESFNTLCSFLILYVAHVAGPVSCRKD